MEESTMNILYYLLVEKMYPLTKHTLHQMFNDVKLQVDYECEMAFKLLRLVKKQLKEGYLMLLVQKLLLLELNVTTAERIKTAQRKDEDCLWDIPMRNIKMIGSMSETKVYHGSMKIHGLMMEHGMNLLIISIMNAIRFVSKMGLLNGLLVIGRGMDIDQTLTTYWIPFQKILEESINIMEKLSDDEWDHDSPVEEWKDYEDTTYIKTDASSNQNTYNKDDNDDIGDLEDYLIQKDPLYYVNEDEERSK
ncbi:hypothetical protein Tco_0375629 [Tanacetum coccineum]